MFKVKYIIADGSAIVFSPALKHSEMAAGFNNIDGAGFVSFRSTQDEYGDTVIVANCYGESISLGIKSRGDLDSRIVTRQISNPTL